MGKKTFTLEMLSGRGKKYVRISDLILYLIESREEFPDSAQVIMINKIIDKLKELDQ